MANAGSPAALIKGLYETHLNVANLDRSMQFYGTVLGLELGTKEERRRVAIYWMGGWGKSALGLWEKSQDEIVTQHFAFEVELADLGGAIDTVKRQGIELRNFFDEPTEVPSVFGWMPAASIYFEDPDGHVLEFLAKLPGKPKPEVGIVALDEWQRTA